jgi:hypothetical protein
MCGIWLQVSDSSQSRDRLGEIFCQEKESLAKRQYQINKRRAAQRFEPWAKSNPVPIQLTFPTAGIAELAQHSLGDLLHNVGTVFILKILHRLVCRQKSRRFYE